MSVYSELLLMTLREQERPDPGLAELVARTLRRRAELADASAGPTDAMADFGSSLAYDTALVTLCRRLGVKETLTLGVDLAAARKQAEVELAEHFPSIRSALGKP